MSTPSGPANEWIWRNNRQHLVSLNSGEIITSAELSEHALLPTSSTGTDDCHNLNKVPYRLNAYVKFRRASRAFEATAYEDGLEFARAEI